MKNSNRKRTATATRRTNKRTNKLKIEQPDYIPTELDRRVEHWLLNSSPPILILISPPGYGKSLTVAKVLERHPEFPHVWIPATRGLSTLAPFFGHWELVPGKQGPQTRFVEGELLKGLKTPHCVIVLDDVHTIAPATQILNGVGDHTRIVSCPELSLTVKVAEGVRVVLIVNPAPSELPPWERLNWELPEQIRSRSRMMVIEAGLSREEEKAIALLHWPKDHREELLDGLLEVVAHLRDNSVLESYSPSLRDLVLCCQLLAQGLPLGTAYMEAIGNKFLRPDEREAAVEAFRAKFDLDPLSQGSVLQGEGG